MLLGIIAGSFAFGTRGETELTRNLVENTKARALAEGALYRAVFGLLAENSRRFSTPSFQRVLRYRFRTGSAQVIVEDEGGKINLNLASQPLLRAMFGSAVTDDALADRLTDAVLDWRDRDHLQRLNGAEDNDYRREGFPYGAKDSPFESVAELQAVMEMTPEIFEKLSTLATVYSETRGIDPMVAPAGVLKALPNLEDGQVDAWIEARGTPDFALPPLSGARRYFSRSRRAVFKLRVLGRTDRGTAFIREAIVRLRSGRRKPFVIHTWRQGSIPDSAEIQAGGRM